MPLHITALLALILPVTVFADASDFNYLDIAYVSQDSPDANGFSALGSYRFHRDFFAEFSYMNLSLDDPALANADASLLTAGLGFVVGENETGSFSMKAAFLDASDKVSVEIEETGYQAGLSIRMNTSHRSELSLDVLHRDLDIVSGMLYSGRFVFDVTEPVSVMVSITEGDDELTSGILSLGILSLGVRINF